jgi:glycosyltransferase involved in cell wall biosynthesis
VSSRPCSTLFKMRTPLVSIGLGVYNGEKFLRTTLESIVSQTFGDFELIISDNRSTDGSGEICMEFAAKDKRIRYSRNPANIGLNGNFNRVFHLSSGRYFRWAAADDVFAPTSLQECVDVLDRSPEVVLCYPKTILIDAEGNILGGYDDNLDLRAPGAADRFQWVLQNIGLGNVQYGLIRTNVLRRTSLFGSFPGSDVVLIAELALYGQFCEIPQYLFFRRMHDAATSSLVHKPLETAQTFWNAKASSNVDLHYWTHRYHNLLSILRSPLGTTEKLRCLSVLARYAVQSRHSLLRELHGAGGQLLKRLIPERNH